MWKGTRINSKKQIHYSSKSHPAPPPPLPPLFSQCSLLPSLAVTTLLISLQLSFRASRGFQEKRTNCLPAKRQTESKCYRSRCCRPKDVLSILCAAFTVLTRPNCHPRATVPPQQTAQTSKQLTRSKRPFLEYASTDEADTTCAVCQVSCAVLKQMACSSRRRRLARESG